MRKTQLLIALAAVGFAGSAFATNGMNLEGYGPIAAGMGGASMAYDNGNAAVMNNPATLGLAADGSRLDIAVGMLGPDVEARCDNGPCAGAKAASGGDSYFMPAVGWTKKNGPMTYGAALFAQGGMGTEYSGNTFMSAGTGLPTRSELGVGRLIAPLAFEVNDKLSIGGSLDYVWAMLDIQMAASAAQVQGMTGGMDITGFGANTAYLSFSDDSDYTGKAKGSGFAGKIGVVYKATPALSLGATYHSKTHLGDLKTSSNGTSFGLYNVGLAGPAHVMTDTGKMTVVDFQWPETFGFGLAFQATPAMLIAADIKQIGWKDVMKNFTMVYSSAMMGSVTMTMPQNWDDQTVIQLGMSYKVSDPMTLRIGYNHASNPIPNALMNPLFPAIVEDHYTFGIGYSLNKTQDVNFSLQYGPESSQTNPGNPASPQTNVTHSQTSWQLMYSKRF
jgi:long-chain fatty acid transport protein